MREFKVGDRVIQTKRDGRWGELGWIGTVNMIVSNGRPYIIFDNKSELWIRSSCLKLLSKIEEKIKKYKLKINMKDLKNIIKFLPKTNITCKKIKNYLSKVE